MCGEHVYNCCSPFLSLAEGVLFYGKFFNSIETIVQCLDDRESDGNTLFLTDTAYMAFSLSDNQTNTIDGKLLSPVVMLVE